MKIFFQLRWYFRKEWRRYTAGIVMLVIVSVLSLLPPYVTGVIVDHIAADTIQTSILLSWAGILILAGILMYLFRFWWRIMIFGASIRLARLLRNKLYEQFTAMSPSFYSKKRTGDLMAHATNDIKAVEQTAGVGVLTLVDSLTMGAFVIAAMAFTISPSLTLYSLLPMPIMALATSWYGSLLHKRFSKAQAAFSSLNNKVQESISGIRVTKTLGFENEDIQSFAHQSDDVVKKNEDVARIDALFDPTISLIVGVSYFLAVFFGAGMVIDGDITLGELTSFTLYLGMLIWPMLAFGWFFNIIERGRASYNRINSLLAEKQEITDEKASIETTPTGRLDITVPHFSYSKHASPVLSEVFIQTEPGMSIGITGRTGSGKSTLMRLLLREIEGKEVEISIGGAAHTSYYLQSYRKAFGYVPQSHFLFSMTIADNIAVGKPDASFSEITAAAGLAHVHDDIITMEHGYETMVGERGITLSGGQKQRVAIARALLLVPEILLLDDSLSAVDAKTEEAILQNIKAERHHKTTFIVSHRMSAIKHCDELIVMEKGQIKERGTHEELMGMNGWYEQMYNQQQLESLVEEGTGHDRT
ncbi:ABC transporter transmembrane domain-containing protein [Alteribacillus sp. HJP-4]|uniref:ABC transporter transmembrane domain-containing protein n=1 Tax=Alteribacillus sp. HJP-4 TaxID=2775394 RepID=UPI0035CD2B5F